MSFIFKNLVSLFSRNNAQPQTRSNIVSKPDYIKEVAHLNVASIVCDEIDSEEFEAARAHFHRRKAEEESQREHLAESA